MTDELFKKIGAAEKATEEALSAVYLFAERKGSISRRDAKQLRARLNRIQDEASNAELKLFRITPSVRIAIRGKKAVFLEN